MDTFVEHLLKRRAAPAAVVAVVCPFLLWGGLTPQWALAGLAAVVAWAGLWPTTSPADAPSATAPTVPLQKSAAPAAPVAMAGHGLPLSLLDALPDAALLLDSRGLIVTSNAAAQALSAVLIGRPHSHWVRAPELLDAVKTARETGEQQRCHVRLFTPVERSLAAIVSPIANEETSSRQLLVIVRDLTDQEQLSRLHADFVANASHELRTPLASIRGFVETLQGAAKEDPAAQARFLAIMQAQAERMSRLIEDLLSLSRIELREHVAPTTPVDLNGIAQDAIASLKQAAEKIDVTLIANIPHDQTLVIGDRDELAQVAQNLVQNAIKYGRKGGQVEVTLRRRDQQVELAVVDNGIGIAPEHLPRLTERFYRVSAKDSKERGGTGLGLAIVKHIVNRHRGELQISSVLGQGSTFTVAMPAATVVG